MTMFKTLRQWMTIPIVIKPFVKYSGTGDPEYSADVDTKCYVSGKTTIVTTADGKEEVSNLQLYLPGEVAIKETDAVTLNNDVYRIKAIGPFYDGNTGEVSIRVVYI